MNKKIAWLAKFKAQFQVKTGINSCDAGLDDSEAINLYYPQDVKDAVLQYMEKYDLDDMEDPWMK